MNIILLSGGSGKRLWPLSNEIRSKQFIKLFKGPDGEPESMVQRVWRQIHAADPAATVTVATSHTQVSALHNQLGADIGISVEPCRRDTFPAIALAAAYLHDVQGVPADEAVVICPVDPYVEQEYFAALQTLGGLAAAGTANLMLMGIEPTYPSEKYGYIIPKSTDAVSAVTTFKEKPDTVTAQRYIDRGALWNGGVFACRLDYLLRRAAELLGTAAYRELFDRYADLPKISFDYAVVEHEPDIGVLRFAGQWKDIGSWATLTEAMGEHLLGKVLCDDACKNLAVLNEMDVPVLCMGLEDVIVSASADGILVTTRERSSHIKPFVDRLEGQVMYAEKSWGSFHVIDVEDTSMTIKVTLNPGHGMNYHSHDYRSEVWTVISGVGSAIVDGMMRTVRPGDVITMPAGCRHTVVAHTELQLIEVQLGADITVHDKHKYPMPE